MSGVRAEATTALPAAEPLRGRRSVLRALLADGWARFGVIVVLVFVVAALFAPLLCALSGQDPYTYHLDALDDSGAPLGFGGGVSATHWFGVEPLTGRDLFAIVLYGARTSLAVGLCATAVSVTIGVLFGVSAGYAGGWYDRWVSRAIDVMFGFPGLIFIIALNTIVPDDVPKPLLMIAVIGFFGWPAVARVVRSHTLSLRERHFVQAAQAMGARTGHVLGRQLLPNLSAIIIVYATIMIPGMIGTEAALSFLGVGVPPPTPSWGRTIGDAVTWVQVSPLYLIIPGLALLLVTIGFNALGDGLRDALDPKSATARTEARIDAQVDARTDAQADARTDAQADARTERNSR